MSVALPTPLAHTVMTNGNWRGEELAALGIAARVPSPLAPAIVQDAASISLRPRMTIKRPSFLVTDPTQADARFSSTVALETVANAVPDVIIPSSGAVQKTLLSLAGNDGVSARKFKEDGGRTHRNRQPPSRPFGSNYADDRGAFVPSRPPHEQTERDEDARPAEVRTPKPDTTGRPSLVNLEAIYRRLAHAKAQLPKIPRDNLPVRDGGWPDPARDHSSMGEAETATPFEATEPKGRRPSEVPVDKPVNASLVGSRFRRNSRGKLVMRPLPDSSGDAEVRVAVNHGGPTPSVPPAIESAPERNHGNDRGFKVSDKFASAVKRANSATSVQLLGRGLHPKIDLWLDAGDQNDRNVRLRRAANVGSDPVAKAKVLELDKSTQVRLARDWEANRLSRDLGDGGRDGRGITDE